MSDMQELLKVSTVEVEGYPSDLVPGGYVWYVYPEGEVRGVACPMFVPDGNALADGGPFLENPLFDLDATVGIPVWGN